MEHRIFFKGTKCFNIPQSLFSFYKRMVIRTMKMSFYRRKYSEIIATLPTPQKASGSVLKTMWSFNSNKNMLISTSYWLWLIKRKAFYRHCIPRSISINDTVLIRNFYPKKFHPWYKSKKLSKDFPPTWWEFAYDHFWLQNCDRPVVKYIIMITA